VTERPSGSLGTERPEHEDYIKRVIGLPGETVELRGGDPLVDDVRVPGPYPRRPPETRPYGPVEVPVDALLVLCDNRTNSNDSRFGLGFVPEDKVIGRAFATAWPPSRVGWIR
jgi:signal peptidase I